MSILSHILMVKRFKLLVSNWLSSKPDLQSPQNLGSRIPRKICKVRKVSPKKYALWHKFQNYQKKHSSIAIMYYKKIYLPITSKSICIMPTRFVFALDFQIWTSFGLYCIQNLKLDHICHKKFIPLIGCMVQKHL